MLGLAIPFNKRMLDGVSAHITIVLLLIYKVPAHQHPLGAACTTHVCVMYADVQIPNNAVHWSSIEGMGSRSKPLVKRLGKGGLEMESHHPLHRHHHPRNRHRRSLSIRLLLPRRTSTPCMCLSIHVSEFFFKKCRCLTTPIKFILLHTLLAGMTIATGLW